MQKSLMIIIFLLMFMVTIAYCGLIYLVINAFQILVVASNKVELSNLTRISADNIHVWQGLAVFSFIANILRVILKGQKNRTDADYLTAAVIHFGFLFLCLLLHLTGILLPFETWAYVIK
jgi:hypothetical protein